MLTDDEYNKLLPFRRLLMEGNATKGSLILINEILQRTGFGTICFDCSGSIARAITQAQDMIKEYEKAQK